MPDRRFARPRAERPAAAWSSGGSPAGADAGVVPPSIRG